METLAYCFWVTQEDSSLVTVHSKWYERSEEIFLHISFLQINEKYCSNEALPTTTNQIEFRLLLHIKTPAACGHVIQHASAQPYCQLSYRTISPVICQILYIFIFIN